MTWGPPLEVLPAAAWPDRVAGLLADRLSLMPDLVVALPTGTTPLPVYERLPAVLHERGVGVGRATVVMLDEYLGLAAGQRARCDAVLRRTLLDRLDPSPRVLGFEVDACEPEALVVAFDAALAALGGLDLVVLGLGSNGHVGMNEPGSAADSPTRVVALTPSTREAAAGYGAAPAPTHGVTMGMASILAAREVWLLATGTAKADILAGVLDGPIGPDVPASLLRDHPGLRIVADEWARPA